MNPVIFEVTWGTVAAGAVLVVLLVGEGVTGAAAVSVVNPATRNRRLPLWSSWKKLRVAFQSPTVAMDTGIATKLLPVIRGSLFGTQPVGFTGAAGVGEAVGVGAPPPVDGAAACGGTGAVYATPSDTEMLVRVTPADAARAFRPWM